MQREQPVLRVEFLSLRVLVGRPCHRRTLRLAPPDLLTDVLVLLVVVFQLPRLMVTHLHEEAIDDVSVVLVVANLVEY